MIQIIPAIDIIDGRCVRLSKGEFSSKKTYDGKPEEIAERYAACGVKRIHIVDLDGARESRPCNLKILEKAAALTGIEIEWGGGVSSEGALESVLNAGASQAIIGSLAVREPDTFSRWLDEYGPDKLVLGADVRGRRLAVSAWSEDSETEIGTLIGRFLPSGLDSVICTDISRDGMLSGPNSTLYAELIQQFPGILFTASGGVGSGKDIEELSAIGMKRVIVGKAIYENRITLKDLEKWSQNA